MKITFEEHLRTTLDFNNALRALYPEKKLTKKEPKKESGKKTKS